MDSFQLIRQSFIEVVKNSIAKEPQDSILPLKKGYLTRIDTLDSESKTMQDVVFLLFDKPFLRIVWEEVLGDDDPDDQALEDMAKELTNLIVGHAKVLAQEAGEKAFNISLPEYLGIKLIKNYNKGLHFKLGQGHCGIYIRNSHA